MPSNMRQHEPAAIPAMSDEQFDRLVALLQPGFELSTLMLADYKAQRAALANESRAADTTG